MDDEIRKHSQMILSRNHVTLDELLPLCKTYQDAKEWAKDIEENYSEYVGFVPETTEKWDNEVLDHMDEEWYDIVWNAIKKDRWIRGSTCGHCLHLLREQYLSSEKWHIPLPKRFN